MIITTPQKMIEVVKEKYRCHDNDSELTGSFFDFDVDMTKADILYTYGAIQCDINDDYIWVNSDELHELTERYVGNCRKYLESLNGYTDFYIRYSGGEINEQFI